MNWELVFQAVQALAVLIGVVFGLIQLRHIREQREIQAGVELLDPLQAPATAETLLQLHGLPDGLAGDELRRRLGDHFGQALATMSYFEALGPLVARGYIPIGMYAEFYRGPTTILWRKTRGYVEEQRAAGWPHLFEWLQWLAERMEERAPATGDSPAFIRCRDWKSPADYRPIVK
jgi:hypothetical protein